jgi:exopolysaccharide biosynthesis polyprenyl glycosylphosphotransferase
MLALADVAAALSVAIWLALVPGGTIVDTFWAAVFVPAWIVVAKVLGLYDRDQRALRHLTVDEIPQLVVWALAGTALLNVFLWATPAGTQSFGARATAWLVALASVVVLRGVVRIAWRRIVPRERAVVIGSGPLAAETRRKLELFPDIHVDIAEQLGEDELAEAEIARADRVILASGSIDEELIADLLAACRAHGVKLSVVPPARGMFGTAVRLNHVADLPVVEYNTWDVSRSTLLLKRSADVALSLAGLLVLAPLLVAIGIAVRLDSRGPALFRQTRAGQDGRTFRMLKFRTMVREAEARLPDLVALDRLPDPMFKLRDDPRVTRVGRVLRRTSLDELPQLVNVLRGDMSLVGPRPEQVELVDRYEPEHRFRLLVRPGLTGPMQVFGRGELTFEERLAVEREYIENLSLGRDARILALTVSAVVHGKGAF